MLSRFVTARRAFARLTSKPNKEARDQPPRSSRIVRGKSRADHTRGSSLTSGKETRWGKFLAGVVWGLLFAWVAAQFELFRDGADFARWMIGWALFWGGLSLILPVRAFEWLINFFRH